MRAIEIGGNHGFLIVGLRRANGTVQVNPSDEEVLREGDTVIVLGHAGDLPALRRCAAATSSSGVCSTGARGCGSATSVRSKPCSGPC